MIRATTFAGKCAAVFGLGASGLAAARALLAGGAEVAAWDDNPASREAARRAGIPLLDLSQADWSPFAALILAPGVPLTHPRPHWTVEKARSLGIEVIGDIELFFRKRAAHAPGAPVVAVTGTNGKSTTTALIAHMLRRAGKDVQLGGNIGVPVLALEPPSTERVYVLELSSFQIDLTPSLAPTIGVLLNVTPDHLDRHGSMENYATIKGRLVASAQQAVIGADDEWCRALQERLAADGRRVESVSVQRELAQGWFARGTRLVSHSLRAGSPGVFADLTGIGSLRGRHNAQNALAASAAAVLAGAGVDSLQGALSTYPGLPHRMEEVGRLGKVLFINDSKATNADSTDKALASFPSDIFWIAGGKPKEGGIASLAGYFPRIAKAYLIGQAAEEFARTLGRAVPFEMSGTLSTALAAAARDAAHCPGPEPVVLLSPACASYDQFKHFEERGDTFRRLVAGLPGVETVKRPE
jgi:UDP-N-acetylmuramoylalanine--D-glutamate ligase